MSCDRSAAGKCLLLAQRPGGGGTASRLASRDGAGDGTPSSLSGTLGAWDAGSRCSLGRDWGSWCPMVGRVLCAHPLRYDFRPGRQQPGPAPRVPSTCRRAPTAGLPLLRAPDSVFGKSCRRFCRRTTAKLHGGEVLSERGERFSYKPAQQPVLSGRFSVVECEWRLRLPLAQCLSDLSLVATEAGCR